MRYLLDTNLISELRKGDRANRGVQAWSLANDPSLCALSVITIGEIRMGIEGCRSTDSLHARLLEEWLGQQISLFGNQILPVTLDIADRWGRLMSATQSTDMDLMIAATALEYDLTVVTRNVGDFARAGVRIVNPWK